MEAFTFASIVFAIFSVILFSLIMRSLNLDLAGEYLVLAATLIHIKSRLLLPREEDDDTEDGQDPRVELVQQLLEYQSYKDNHKRWRRNLERIFYYT